MISVEELYEVGDGVKVVLPKDIRITGMRGINVENGILHQHGEVGVITRFHENYFGRINNGGMKPGVHVVRYKPYVHFGLDVVPFDAFYLKPTDGRFLNGRRRMAKVLEQNPLWKRERNWIRELPETPFWEGDRVAFRHHETGALNEGVVTAINFHYFDGKDPDCRLALPFKVEPALIHDTAQEREAYEGDLELVQRGNVWNYYNGDPIKWKDLKEEADFYALIGKAMRVGNYSSGEVERYADKLIEKIKAGEIDGFKNRKGFFRGLGFAESYLFDDRQLGARVARLTLASLGVEITPPLFPQDTQPVMGGN